MVMEFQSESFRGIVVHDCETQMRVLNAYSAPIGMYIAAASLLCASLMFADLVHAIRWRNFWFPSKYFTLNAATLTFLGVAVKLSLDISSPMPPTDTDRFAKYCNILLMATIMGNFSTSLCSMDAKSLVSNMIALVILDVTVFVNLIIQVKTGLVSYDSESREYRAIFSILGLLIMLINFAIYVPFLKLHIEVHYNRKYEMVLNEDCMLEGKLHTARLELVIKKLWIIAVTSNLQFVIANIIWVFHFISVLVNIRVLPRGIAAVLGFKRQGFGFLRVESIFSSSDYSWSMIWILKMQSIGFLIAFLSLVMRLSAIIFRLNNKPLKTTRVLGRGILPNNRIPLQLQIVWCKCLKVLSRMYRNKVIFIQVLVFVKILGMFNLFILKPAISYIVNLKDYIRVHRIRNSSVQSEQEAELDVELAHLGGYALRLYFFQNRLSKTELNMIYYEQHQVIQSGKRRRPKSLFQLLQRSNSFIGVNNFDQIQVPSLCTKEPPSCWTLPVMTLARIAIALPQEDYQSFDHIIESVTEGLKYGDLVDKSLEAKQELQNIRNAVKVKWLNVELDHKWLKVNPIMRTSSEAKSSKEILQDLASTAKTRVDKFKEGGKRSRFMDHIHWPNEVVVANSMYRISSASLLAYDEEGNAQTTAAADDGLLDKLLDTIADILSACLTNLPYVMTRECL